MKIGVIGAGNIGQALGALWVQQGHEVLFSFSRDEQKLQAVAEGAGPTARSGTVAEAMAFGEAVLLAVPYDALDAALGQAGEADGKILITTVSALRPDPQVLGMRTDRTDSVAEEVARRLPEARVVEAFNTTFDDLIQLGPTRFGDEQASILYCGDNPSAKASVARLISDAGYVPVDAGALANARTVETLATLWVQVTMVTGTIPNAGLRLVQRANNA